MYTCCSLKNYKYAFKFIIYIYTIKDVLQKIIFVEIRLDQIDKTTQNHNPFGP